MAGHEEMDGLFSWGKLPCTYREEHHLMAAVTVRHDALRHVLARAEAHESSRLALERAIREAHDAGHSVREIAEAAQADDEPVRCVTGRASA